MVKSRRTNTHENPRLWLVEAYGWLDVARGLGLWFVCLAAPALVAIAGVALFVVATVGR
jgi:hypothetical protein